MILQNGFRDYSVCRYHGAGVLNNAYPATITANFARTGARRNLTVGEGITDKMTGIPVGYLHPRSWQLPQKTGGLGAGAETHITVSVGDLNLAAGMYIDGTGAIVITVPDAGLQLIVSATGTGTIEISVANALLAGSIEAVGTTDITITVPNATLGALVDSIGTAGITLTGDLTSYAIGHLAGDILPYTELSPQALATEILDLQDVETGLTVREAFRLIAAATAGKVSGASGTTITIRSAVADDNDRIVATVDSNGNRTAITYDLD